MLTYNDHTTHFNVKSDTIDLHEGIKMTVQGCTGTIRESSPDRVATRSLTSPLPIPDLFSQVLGQAHMSTLKEFELEATPNLAASRSLTTTPATHYSITLDIPKDPQKGYAILHYEAGEGYRWLFPTQTTQLTRSLAPSLTFQIPLKPEQAVATRSLVFKTAKKILRLVGWDLEDVAGQAAYYVVKRWEEAKRPYGLHHVSREGLRPVDDWQTLQGGKALLLLHGTFSTTEATFGELLQNRVFDFINSSYKGRIIGFDHPSLHHDPGKNVEQILEYLKGKSLELDILSLSRGGLVGRELIYQLAKSGSPIKVDRNVMIASPNRGTLLADAAYMTDLLDQVTNLITYLPVNPFTNTLDAILTIVKIVGGGGVAALPGLQAMNPGSRFLKHINRKALNETSSYSISADFAPTDTSWFKRTGKWAFDQAVDLFFGEVNDGVTPTHGAYDTRPKGSTSSGDTRALKQNCFYVPESNRFIFHKSIDIHHMNYFQSTAVNQQILKFLDVALQ